MSKSLHSDLARRIGRMMKAAREEAGYASGEAAATAAGWKYPTYRKWEFGQRLATLETLTTFADALGATVDVRIILEDGTIVPMPEAREDGDDGDD